MRCSSGAFPRRGRPTSCSTTNGSSTESPLADPLDARAELVEVGDSLLEQVADPIGAVGEQLDRVARADVLREDEDPDARASGADLLRRPQPLVGMRGRHADVDDRDVWTVELDQLEQLIGVGGEPDDFEARLDEQPRQPFAEQQRRRQRRLLARDLHA